MHASSKSQQSPPCPEQAQELAAKGGKDGDPNKRQDIQKIDVGKMISGFKIRNNECDDGDTHEETATRTTARFLKIAGECRETVVLFA